jgi:hypothetical protein
VLTRAKVGRAGIFQRSQTLTSLAFFMRALFASVFAFASCRESHSAVAISLRIISRDSASKQQRSDVDGDF